MMSPSLRRLLIAAALLAVALGVVYGIGGWTRTRLGIELDVDSVRSFAAGLGMAGPVLFVFVVAGRSFLALPSQIVLIAAGLCFGTWMGAIVGGTGLMLSGLALFLVARYAGREAVEARMGPRGRRLLGFASHRSGAASLAIACGYPIMPLSPIQAAAGLTPMSIGSFVPAAFLGGSIRAAIFAGFGDTLIDVGWSTSLYAVALFMIMAAVPLVFPSGRAWLREILAPAPALRRPTAREGGSAPNRP